ncbi:MAG: RnfABCDGE type electron transport complex subunit B [SAR324 cluster bacterium]|nr:RnfABCDGE type electron transport complex subunit B [SAR324 cluster bacterium]
MDFREILTALVILTSLGLMFSTLLAIAYKKLKVYEDPRIDRVQDMLPGANCGACGQPGCKAFAEELVAGNTNPGKCTVSSLGGIELIAGFLGVEAVNEEKRVARLLCAGGKNEAHNRANYKGSLQSCRGEATVAGGGKECSWGCLGLGDCEVVCDFDAIAMNRDGLPVVDIEKCTACGDCVDICPKNLFVIMPVGQQLLVQCKSELEGDLATNACTVACNACSRCVSDAPNGLIEIRNGYAQINYELNDLAAIGATQRCPTGSIVWLHSKQQFDERIQIELPLGRIESGTYDSDAYYQ